MNPIAEEILMHYGMPRRSGRYPVSYTHLLRCEEELQYESE